MKTIKSIVTFLILFLCPLGICAQSSTMMIEDHCILQINGIYYKLNSYIEIPKEKSVQEYFSGLLFNEENSDLKTAYDTFLKEWHREDIDTSKTVSGTIEIRINKEYELDGKFLCYHVSGSLSDKHFSGNLSEISTDPKIKMQYFLLSSGVDQGIIVDIKKQEIVTLDKIFIPVVAKDIRDVFGNDISLYAEDRCLHLFSKKNEGQLLFNETTQGNFTDYFKQLVGWGQQQDIDTPHFLRGEAGLNKYFGKKLHLASDKEYADTVFIGLVIDANGNPLQPTIAKGSKYVSDEEILSLCGKMPKWVPAYQNGMPVPKRTIFTLRVLQEKMPTYPGGMGALMQYLASNIKYPVEAEENGIKGRVICTYIVETDGSITDVKVIKSVAPSLDKEAVRVISAMPKWIPGEQAGKPVRVKYTLPVTFNVH